MPASTSASDADSSSSSSCARNSSLKSLAFGWALGIPLSISARRCRHWSSRSGGKTLSRAAISFFRHCVCCFAAFSTADPHIRHQILNRVLASVPIGVRRNGLPSSNSHDLTAVRFGPSDRVVVFELRRRGGGKTTTLHMLTMTVFGVHAPAAA
jgi:hypothetical protein